VKPATGRAIGTVVIVLAYTVSVVGAVLLIVSVVSQWVTG
jgi:hypothetical protein